MSVRRSEPGDPGDIIFDRMIEIHEDGMTEAEYWDELAESWDDIFEEVTESMINPEQDEDDE